MHKNHFKNLRKTKGVKPIAEVSFD